MLKVKFQNTMFYFVYPLGRCEEVKKQNLNYIKLLPLITPSPEMPAAITVSSTSYLPNLLNSFYGGFGTMDGNTSVSSIHSFLKIA